MALSADNLLERMQLKSQVSRWRMVAIVVAALLLLLVLMPNDDSSSPLTLGGKFIARVEVNDIILEGRERDTKLREIAKNDNAVAVIVHINSPGGSIVGGETLYYAMQSLAKEKPVVVVMGGLAASGGYMAALPAHHILAHEGTLTGSIGVILQTAEFTELADKLGVKLLTFKSGDLKATPSPFEKVSPAARSAIESSIQSGFDMFVRMVAESREMNENQVRKIADGRVYTGAQALENGLVDAIGSEQDALLWLQEVHQIGTSLSIRDISLKPEKSKFDEFYTSIWGGNSMAQVINGMQGLMVLWKP